MNTVLEKEFGSMPEVVMNFLKDEMEWTEKTIKEIIPSKHMRVLDFMIDCHTPSFICRFYTDKIVGVQVNRELDVTGESIARVVKIFYKGAQKAEGKFVIEVSKQEKSYDKRNTPQTVH